MYDVLYYNAKSRTISDIITRIRNELRRNLVISLLNNLYLNNFISVNTIFENLNNPMAIEENLKHKSLVFDVQSLQRMPLQPIGHLHKLYNQTVQMLRLSINVTRIVNTCPR